MKNLNRFLPLQMLALSAVAVAAFVSSPAPARAQSNSMTTCENWVLDSNNDYHQVNCVSEYISDDTPEVLGSVEVTSNNTAYYPYVDAEIILSDPKNFLGQADYNQFEDPSTGSSDAWVGLTATETANDVYDDNGGYGVCYDSTGSYGYNGCTWNDYGNNPFEDLGTNITDPSYKVTSLLYPPPGNESTEWFGDFTTNGTTTSTGTSFQNAQNISFTGGSVFGGSSASVGFSSLTSNTTAFQTTLTDQTGMTELANTESAYNPNAYNMPEHQWDTFEILLNPQITTASDDSANVVGYAMDLQPVPGEGWFFSPDFAQPVVEDMINGTVPAEELDQEQLPNEGNGTFYQAGLASICQNLITLEYYATPSTCTLADQCGCQVSDFSTILAQAPLLQWNPGTLTANPLPGYESPLEVDTSGVTACEEPTSSDSCRYVPVPVSSSDPAPQTVILNYAAGNSFTQTDSTTANQTLSEQQSYSTGVSHSYGFNDGAAFDIMLTTSDTFTWTNSESTGVINGYGNSMNVNLQTTSSGCYETNYVYEDTIFHTFVVQPPEGISDCE